MKKVNAVLLRGFMGTLFSRGMDTLGTELWAIPGVDYVAVGDFTDIDQLPATIDSWTDDTILIGHSYGGASIMKAAWETKRSIPAMFIFDLSQYEWMNPLFWNTQTRVVPMNVEKCFNFYQRRSLPWGIGDQKVYRESGSEYKIKNLEVEPHLHITIDDDPTLHQKVISEVKKIVDSE